MEKMLVSPSPQIRDNISTSKVMTHVLVALCPALAMSAYVFGGRALMLTGFCMITALIWERLCNLIMKRPDSTKDVSALVTGMLLAFNLPVTMPYWQAAIGTFVAIVIVKQLFGGLGQNFANPAIVGRIVLMLAFTGNMTHWVVPFYDPDNIVTGATPLAGAHSAPAGLTGEVFGADGAGFCVGNPIERGQIDHVFILSKFINAGSIIKDRSAAVNPFPLPKAPGLFHESSGAERVKIRFRGSRS